MDANKNKVKNGDYASPPEQPEDTNDTECGIGSCHPDGLQCCARMGCFSFVYGFSGIVTSSLQMYINSQITTLEKQFGFSSSVSGLLLSSNDIGFLLTTLVFSYMARRTHIPRVLMLSTIIYGLSGLLCSSPHFLNMDRFRLDILPSNITSMTSSGSNMKAAALCVNTSFAMNATQQCAATAELDENDATIRTVAIALIAIGMSLQGIGKSPRVSFLATYIDDNVVKTKTPLYIGAIFGMSVFGPALGFILGGVFSQMYVTLEETDMSVRDPRWIGAWWLGFLVFGSIATVAALPLMFFPRKIKSRPITQQMIPHKTTSSICEDLKVLVKSICRIITTPIYLCSTLSTCCVMFTVGGMLAFLPKYIESQYNIPTWMANILVGALNVFSASIGIIAGGILTAKLKLRPITCLKLVVGLTLVVVIISPFGFFTGCDSPVIHMGVNSKVSLNEINRFSHASRNNMTYSESYLQNNVTYTSGACDVNTCYCDDTRYFPVCGSDSRNYFSPCHAGCNNKNGNTFQNCTCIGEDATAEPGLCRQDCGGMQWVYVSATFVCAFVISITVMPSFIVCIRSIKESDKPLGVGLQSLLLSLLGFIPGPVVFGKAIDTTCLIWSTSCSGKGACLLYDNDDFRIKYHVLFLGFRILSLLLYVVALIFAYRSKQPFHVESIHTQTIAEKELFLGEKEDILNTKGTKV